MGKLIIIEGGDGSGKATQTKKIVERLELEGYPVMSVSFPDYESQSSALVKMYLHGDFGTKPDDVNPYAASTFYAVDRYASYNMNWKKFYNDGGIVIADRYTTSNMVHQMVKYEDHDERKEFLNWLEDLEFTKLELPKPDLVCLLDVPVKVTRALMKDRVNKTGGKTGDIHEKDFKYLDQCHNAYDELVERYDWKRVPCTQNDEMKTIEDIHELVYKIIKEEL